MLEPRHLTALQAVARSGSLSQAARDLNYTQPAISQQIQSLERKVGVALLLRKGRQTGLTFAGEALLKHANAIMGAMETAEEELAAIAGLRAGRVRMAALPSANATLVPQAVAAFRKRHPKVVISLMEGLPPRSIELVREGQCDIAVAHAESDAAYEDAPDLLSVPLTDDPLSLVLPAYHDQASSIDVQLADLAEETWVAGCPRCRGHLVSACSQAGFEPRIGFETDDNAAAQGLVAAGLGVSLVSDLILRAIRMPGVVVKPIRPSHERAVYAVTLPIERRSRAAAEMIAHLEHIAAVLRSTR